MKRIGLCLLLIGAACRGPENSPEPRRFTAKQIEARFPADLGADTIDVSAYPPEQQAAYVLFGDKCSRCHTLARPINSPYVTREDWERYLARMHLKSEARYKEPLLGSADGAKLLDFLVYDAQARKVQGSDKFQAEQKALAAAFQAVQEERGRIKRREGTEKAVEPAPYVGDKK